MNPITDEGLQRLGRHVLHVAFGGVAAGDRPTEDAAVAFVTARLGEAIPRSDLDVLEALADIDDPVRLTPTQRRRLLLALAMPVLDKAREALDPTLRRDDLRRVALPVLVAATRVALLANTPEDLVTLDNGVRKEGPTMPDIDDFRAAARGLPEGFVVKPLVDATRTRLESLGGPPSVPFLATVVGRLLLDGNIDPRRSDFRHAVKRAYDQGVADTPRTDKPNKELYEKVVADFATLRKGQKIFYQELATVADHVIAAADEWDVSVEATRQAQVQVGMMRFADGTADTGFATLELPPIVSEDASNQEIEPMNVDAVGMVAAAYEIEQTGAFDVVDRMVDLFVQGMLPVRDDSGGRALDRYFWQSEDRLDAAARAGQYARVLGKGGSASPDVQPNAAFEQSLMRFVVALVQYDNDLQVSTVVRMGGGDRPGSSEQVRKCAQDLAANASLYGWGFTIFAARRLSRHIELVFDVLGQETLQRAYGVTGPWQLVERVSSVEFGSTPAIVAHRTRAQGIKDLLQILSGYARELSRSGAGKRFLPSAEDLRRARAADGSTVSLADYDRLVTAANNLLAVGGVTSEEIDRYAAPVASTARGSIPTVGGDGGGADSGGIDQLRQLVAQGQVPSLDQLQRLLPLGTNALG